MTAKELALNLCKGKPLNNIPFLVWSAFVPRGYKERKLRNMGTILVQHCSPFVRTCPNVEISEKNRLESYNQAWTRTYHTPLGEISEKFRRETKYGTGDWLIEHPIKKPSDYDVVRFILEDCIYHENYDAVKKAQTNLGEDGIILAAVPRSPLQRLIVEWAGVERFSMDYYDHRDIVEKLLSVTEEKLDHVYKIAVNSPAEIIWAPDNVTGDVVGPSLYEKYLLPFYSKQAELIHSHGKIYAVHMDGRLGSLADLIQKTNIDVIDSFSLPEGSGDLPIKEALRMWKGKSILANIPSFLGLKSSDEIKRYIKSLQQAISPDDIFAIQYSEDLPAATLWQTLSTIIEVLLDTH